MLLPTAAVILLLLCLLAMAEGNEGQPGQPCISGIYPHLAFFSGSQECGIGAVVPWAGKLWCVTYSPHAPEGSEDKLYEISEDLRAVARPESIGGTPANRLIHRESDQLIIGPYFISAEGRVRAVSYADMPGRPTATMRHLTDPARRVYFFAMEGEMYEVDVGTLQVTRLFGPHPIPGSHAKGGYTSQGRVAVANNGEWGWYDRWAQDHTYDGATGALAEWDGREWRLIERKQFCEVTGPGGILGAPDDASPLWATGWDRRSVILKVLDGGQWHTFRLPKASHTYDGGHGWHTEWPRIREVTDGRLLMTMHGMFYDFPRGFSAARAGGLRPISTYLKMVVDFCDWRGRLVFACNDTSLFDNPLAGQAQSNLWFAGLDDLRGLGAPAGWGGPWVDDPVRAGEPSDPFLLAGFDRRVLHLAHGGDQAVEFTVELDEHGDGAWREHTTVTVPARGYAYHLFPAEVGAEWVRVRASRACTATAYFHYLPSQRQGSPGGPGRFASLPLVGAEQARTTGVLRPRGGDLGTLHFLAERVGPEGNCEALGYYEVGPDMRLRAVDAPQAAAWLVEKAQVRGPDFAVDGASAIVQEADGRRWRLPRTDPAYDIPWPEGWPRGIREVVTERALLNCHGTIYELPRPSSGGVAAMRPVCTHGRRIKDLCSWRGLLVLAGNVAGAASDGHYFPSEDGKTGLWFGTVDDLWGLGRPRGQGGPWKDAPVQAGEPSDPYIMTGFDRKTLDLSHDAGETVTFTIEVDITAGGQWHTYGRISVAPGQTVRHRFPEGYNACWARLRADQACRATAWFTYE